MSAEGTPLILIVLGGLAEGLVLLTFSLIVFLGAMWCRKYLLAEIEALDSEMENLGQRLNGNLAAGAN
jgi:hypothetical protein